MSYPQLQKQLHEMERGSQQQQQRQLPNYPQQEMQEEIPLNRLNSTDVQIERDRIRRIFNHVRDGTLGLDLLTLMWVFFISVRFRWRWTLEHQGNEKTD
jgi:hypothetical protein